MKYNTKGEVLLMGDINPHINCNETDFIINHSDNVLDSFLPKNYIVDSMQVLRSTQIPQTANSYSKSLLEICTSSQLRILNGRTIAIYRGLSWQHIITIIELQLKITV
jgi:hypothetical protein